MPTTPHLGLPLIAAAQAQKHVTHNEALHGLDALVQLAVIRRDLALAPANPAEGDRYIVAPGAAGAWAGHEGEVAHWGDGLWRFHAPRRGWLAYLLDERVMVAWTGTAWGPALAAIGEIEVSRLGVGTAASAANPLAAKLNQALLAGRGRGEGGSGDLRLVLNKEAGARVASLILQSAYSGRAEIGLVGDDDLRLKVSADGQAWTEALRIDRATGQVSFPAGASVPGGLRNRLINGAFQVNQRGYASGAALAAGAYGHDRWKAGAAGCAYTFAPGAVETVITLGSGSLVQVIEAGHVAGGALALSWTGNAGGRVGVGGAAPSGAYAASPLVLAGVPAGQAVSLEFSGGTLGQVQAEGGGATPFERRFPGLEVLLCQRYCRKSYDQGTPPGTATPNGIFTGVANGGASRPVISVPFPPMRVPPSLTFYSPGTGAQNAIRDLNSGADAAVAAAYVGDAGFTVYVAATPPNNILYGGHYLATAEL